MFNVVKFKSLLKKKGLTVKDIEVQTEIPSSTIYAYTSKRSSPNKDNIELFAKALNVEYDDLTLSGDDIDGLSENPYKDALVQELKSEVNYLKKMIEYLT